MYVVHFVSFALINRISLVSVSPMIIRQLYTVDYVLAFSLFLSFSEIWFTHRR